MSNILEVSQQHAIQALIAKGWSINRIARTLGVNRRTVQCYATAAASKCPTKVIAGTDGAVLPKCTIEVEVIVGLEDGDPSKCTTPSEVIAGSRSGCAAEVMF